MVSVAAHKHAACNGITLKNCQCMVGGSFGSGVGGLGGEGAKMGKGSSAARPRAVFNSRFRLIPGTDRCKTD